MPAAERNTLMPALAVQYGADWPQIAASLDAALADYHSAAIAARLASFSPKCLPWPPRAAAGPGQPWMSLNASGPAFCLPKAPCANASPPPLLALVRELGARQ